METEANTSASSAPHLTAEAQLHLSGHAQRIAKILAAQADAEVLRQAVTSEASGASAQGEAGRWDEEVDAARQRLLSEFVEGVRRVVRSRNPVPNPHTEEARDFFCASLTLVLQLALSKYQRILPADTLLGRRGLESLNGGFDVWPSASRFLAVVESLQRIVFETPASTKLLRTE